MAKKPAKEPTENAVHLDPNPKGDLKALGGSQYDNWNMRLSNLVIGASPSAQSEGGGVNVAATDLCSAMLSLAPTDPVEGIIIAQLLAANEASLMLYRKGWAQPPEYFQARTKYLQLADKAARTVVTLTERLDHHRGRGQQQITVKHVTTNNVTADQAIIAESVTTAGGKASSPALLAASSEMPMPLLEQSLPDMAGVGGAKKTK